MRATDSVRDHADATASDLSRAVAAGSLTRHDLRAIYGGRLQRLLSDNNRIWTGGSIFMPLAVSTVGVLAVVDDPGPPQYLTLGFASVYGDGRSRDAIVLHGKPINQLIAEVTGRRP